VEGVAFVKVKETTKLPAWIAYAVENGILDWSDVRTILLAATHRERAAFPWWRTITISLVLVFLCWIAAQS
jgi:hypothetical protein